MLCFLKYMNKGVDVGGFYLVLQRSQVSLCHLKENPRDRQVAGVCWEIVAQVLGLSENMAVGTRQAVPDEEKLGGAWLGPGGGAMYSGSCTVIVFEEIPILQQKDQ